MDGTLSLLEWLRDKRLAVGRLRGVLHLTLGRRITDEAGTLICEGVTWRQLAQLLKRAKYEPELISELDLDPELLAIKEREAFWYRTIALARVDSAEARKDADEIAQKLKAFGYVVGPAPGLPSKVKAKEPEAPEPKKTRSKPKKK